MGNYLFFLLILACPLAMFFMMRGMGRSRGGSADGGHATSGHTTGLGGGPDHSSDSLEELRRQREELDRQIEEHEAEEKTSVAGRWR